MDPIVYLYLDESCLGVQFKDRASPGGGAGLLELWRGERWERRDFWVSEPSTTNNRMALRGAIEGLGALTRPSRIICTSDSNYLVKGMREWIHGWARRGWKRRRGKIENLGLWRELLRVARRHEVDWRWVRGHAGHPQNEYADRLATRAAKAQTASRGLVESGFGEWLEEQRERYGRYFDFYEFAPPPEDESFEPTPLPAGGES